MEYLVLNTTAAWTALGCSADLKNNAIGRKVISTPEGLKNSVLGFLQFLGKSPQRVGDYFNNATTKYAADS